MPDPPNPKAREHPSKFPPESKGATRLYFGGGGHRYAELMVTSNFTFLRGASHPDEFVNQAAALGHTAAAIADTNTLAGVVRAHVAAKAIGIPLAVGCRLVFADESTPHILVYPTDRAAYGQLCQLLTLGKRRTTKGECRLFLHDFIEHQRGLLAVVVPPAKLDDHFVETLRGLRDVIDDDRLSLAASCLYERDDRTRLRQLADLARHVHVPLVATNDAHYHAPGRRALQDVLTCVRHGCTLDQAGYRLFPNAERRLKPPEEMARLFAPAPGGISRSAEVACRAAAFSLNALHYEYPDEIVPAAPGMTAMRHLAELTQAGMGDRYPQGVPPKIQGQIEHELKLIEELNYAPYFLTVHDLVVFARSRGILCQGRGAAANSAVCYFLGVTAVDPDRVNLLFERFVSKERNEPPDIDIDFEHERREEVIQYLYAKYGRDRAALTAEVISYRPRSAVRDVGKAMGLSLDAVDRLAKNLEWWNDDGLRPASLRELGFAPEDPTIKKIAALVRQIQGFPRHLSQHVGGFVITRGPLCESVPIENAAMADRTVIEWDKDDIDALGMLKVDVLGLGMLTCIRKGFELVERHHGDTFTLANVPSELPGVYDMICDADTVGVFQIESRAQMSMLPRLRPRNYYDLVIEVAIVRPGPIQGQMVHPYLKRRNGEEPVSYPSPEVEGVLARTLGVPLFQEQVMSLAIVAAGFTPGEADQLRRAIAAWKSKGPNKLMNFEKRFIGGMLERGYAPEFAERCFRQIQGFGDYGFPESHAASFAHIVYASAWLKYRYPAAFACALINSQPMGFYAPAQIVRDAIRHGVPVRPIDVNHSAWDCTLESISDSPSPALRLGMRLASGLRQADAERLVAARALHGASDSVETLWRRSGVSVSALRRLASADAFSSMGLDRQAALWQVKTLRDESLPLFDGLAPTQTDATVGDALLPLDEADEPTGLPPISPPRKVMHDYHVTGLSLRRHPVSFLRPLLERRHVTPSAELADPVICPNGRTIAIAGIVLVRQRPSTASGIIFMTLEDETGIANLIVRPHIFERYRRIAGHAVVLIARGKVERQGQVVHVMVRAFVDLSREFRGLVSQSRDFR